MATRLLAVEDDYDVAEMLVTYFSRQGYDILYAEDGLRGIEMARLYFPNLILLDVMLPLMDGYEVCRRLRQVSSTRYIPIIFLTQRDERAAKIRGLELGADDYITKPFDVDELRLRVTASLRRAARASLREARTGLPTGPLVAEEIARRANVNYAALRLTIAGFDAYRDVYGFIAADEAFGFAAHSIQSVVRSEGTPDDFIGVEGNAFVVLTHAPDPTELEMRIKAQFNLGVKAFYTFADVDRRGLVVHNGPAGETLVPLMRLCSQRQGEG
ncbi:MAG: response regulator transcription factor [Aggregatilineales bacterium]